MTTTRNVRVLSAFAYVCLLVPNQRRSLKKRSLKRSLTNLKRSLKKNLKRSLKKNLMKKNLKTMSCFFVVAFCGV